MGNCAYCKVHSEREETAKHNLVACFCLFVSFFFLFFLFLFEEGACLFFWLVGLLFVCFFPEHTEHIKGKFPWLMKRIEILCLFAINDMLHLERKLQKYQLVLLIAKN